MQFFPQKQNSKKKSGLQYPAQVRVKEHPPTPAPSNFSLPKLIILATCLVACSMCRLWQQITAVFRGYRSHSRSVESGSDLTTLTTQIVKV